MKRDWDLIRAILIRTEQTRAPEAALDASAFYDLHEDEAVVREHIRILRDGGLIEGPGSRPTVERITFAGYELLAVIRQESVMQRIRAAAVKVGGGIGYDSVKAIGTAVLKSQLGLEDL